MSEMTARRVLGILSVAELLAMALWFTGTTVVPQLTQEWRISLSTASWLTILVQLGFVAGALSSALFNISDVFSAPRVFVISCAAAAVVNGLFAFADKEHVSGAMWLRFLTGFFLAGVYPTGMKIMASWFKTHRGVALGVLVGALTAGKALPHALYAGQIYCSEQLSWRGLVIFGSILAIIAAILVALFIREGPYLQRQAPFRPREVFLMWRNRPLVLANLGYFGHMWELYSMWSWIAVMLAASAAGKEAILQELGAFAAIAFGALGCVWAGWAADKKDGAVPSRARVTIVAMVISGCCCIFSAVVFRSFYALMATTFIWGIAIVADSAQFSAIVSEVAEQDYVGTALAFQTGVGFLLTTASIWLTGRIGQRFGWPTASAALAVGPLLGIVAMLPLTKKASEKPGADSQPGLASANKVESSLDFG